MKSRYTITAARVLALAAMFAAVFGVHLFHPLLHPSDHQTGCPRTDGDPDHRAEAGVSQPHPSEASAAQTALPRHDGAGLRGSCPVCDFFKTRPVQSCFEPADLYEAYTPPSIPFVRADTPIPRHHPLPRLSRAPPAAFAAYTV